MAFEKKSQYPCPECGKPTLVEGDDYFHCLTCGYESYK